MQISIQSSRAAATRHVADQIITSIRQASPTATRPFRLGLATGSAMTAVCQHLLANWPREDEFFEHIVLLVEDESGREYLQRHLARFPLSPLCVTQDDQQSVDLYVGALDSLESSCTTELFPISQGETEMKTEPARFTSLPLPSLTSIIILPPRLAMGASRVVLIATGHDDAASVQRYLEASPTQRPHENLLLVLDEDATMNLQVRTLKVLSSHDTARISSLNPKGRSTSCAVSTMPPATSHGIHRLMGCMI